MNHRQISCGNALLIVIFFQISIFFLTFSKIPASDGFRYVQDINTPDWKFMLLPNHCLPETLIMGLKKMAEFFSLKMATLRFIQSLNTVLSSSCLVLFFFISRCLGLSEWLSLVGASLFGFSYGMWHLANGEIHHIGLTVILTIFLLLLRFREKPSHNLAGLLGFLNVLAMTFHEDHILMCVPIVWMMLAKRPCKSSFRYLLTYIVTFCVLGTAIFGSIAYFVYGIRQPKDFINWFYIYHDAQNKSGYLLVVEQNWKWARLFKGALMSLHYGVQIIVDLIRYSVDYAKPWAVVYAVVTLLSVSLMSSMWLLLIYFFKRLSHEMKIRCFGLLAWVLIYKLVVNANFVPESPEYHLASLAPWLLLIFLPLQIIHQHRAAWFLALGLLISTFSVNLFAGILPQKRYGEMVGRFEQFANSYFKQDDFFISTESGLDFIVEKKWNHLSIKNLFLHSSKSEGFRVLQEKIKTTMDQNRRVFVYNFIPGNYALRGINFYNKGQNLSKQDFERYFAQLKKNYDVRPVINYWESDCAPYYLFNPLSDTLWEIKRL